MTHPNEAIYFNGYQTEPVGLTKREYFAAIAMQGLLASYTGCANPEYDLIAKYSIRYADTLINELNKKP